jgi:predicted GIY-YIG superfamily endonuclease
MEKRYRRMLRALRVEGDAGPRDWSVYIVRCYDESLYTGIAKDVTARLDCHNKGRGAAYTRSRRPVCLRYRKDRLTRSEALVLEARIKSFSRAEKEGLLKAPSGK